METIGNNKRSAVDTLSTRKGGKFVPFCRELWVAVSNASTESWTKMCFGVDKWVTLLCDVLDSE